MHSADRNDHDSAGSCRGSSGASGAPLFRGAARAGSVSNDKPAGGQCGTTQLTTRFDSTTLLLHPELARLSACSAAESDQSAIAVIYPAEKSPKPNHPRPRGGGPERPTHASAGSVDAVERGSYTWLVRAPPYNKAVPPASAGSDRARINKTAPHGHGKSGDLAPRRCAAGRSCLFASRAINKGNPSSPGSC
jgi:hypothetical protein